MPPNAPSELPPLSNAYYPAEIKNIIQQQRHELIHPEEYDQDLEKARQEYFTWMQKKWIELDSAIARERAVAERLRKISQMPPDEAYFAIDQLIGELEANK